jgi:hypothetical protein
MSLLFGGRMSIVLTPEQEQYVQLQMTNAYYQGLREGIELYAHWKDGVQYVGTTGKTLKQALAVVHQEQQDTLAKFDRLKQL